MSLIVLPDSSVVTLAGAQMQTQHLNHNLPGGLWFVQFWLKAFEPSAGYVVRGDELTIFLAEINVSAAYKLIALRVDNGLADGVWWVDDWVFDRNQVTLTFKSSADASGSGEPGSYTGQVLVADQPAQRIVTATALDADPPYLLARTVSDPATGQFTLEWSGYNGQILITAIDDYGVPYVQGEARGVGERLHPSSYNGYTYEVSSTGVLGAEPAWPTTPGAVVISGSVTLVAVPYYRPVTEGPIFV